MFIPISLALLALSAGMLLLAKTNKDNLGLFFKSISLFIIIGSFLVMGLAIVSGITRMMLHGGHEQGAHRHHKRHHNFYGAEGGQRNWRHHWNSDENNMRGYGENEGRGEFEHGEFEEGRGPEHHGFGHGEFGHGGFERHEWQGNNNMDERMERKSKHLSEMLKLNSDQETKLKEIMKTSMEKEKEIWTKSNGDREQFKKLSKENHQNTTESIKKILTPEQLKLFNEKEEQRETGHNPG
jgi:hypothetical protein